MPRKITKIELQFVDLFGNLRSIDVNAKKYKDIKKEGKGIDGSSVGFAPVEKSDLILKPIEKTFFVLPWDNLTGRVLCDIFEPTENLKEKELEISPRFLLKKILKETEKNGFKFFVSAELEFFVLKNGKPIDPQFYFAPTPKDKVAILRRKVFDILLKLKIPAEYAHHEVGAGQQEITLVYAPALEMADKIVTAKFLIKNLAEKEGFFVTFMPKPFSGMPGSGMHIHMSLFDKEGKNLFFGKNRISEIAKNFIGGILKHIKAICAIAASSVNSYKRLVPGFEAPVNICWGFSNRTAAIRIPAFSSKNSARVELRIPDPLANPYLLFALVLASGMEGIKEKIDPGKDCQLNTYKNSSLFRKLPQTLKEALNELQKDSLMEKVLGKALEKYLSFKEREWKEYEKIYPKWNPLQITQWEIERYIDSF